MMKLYIDVIARTLLMTYINTNY